MPTVILDTIDSARFRDGINGFEIIRGVTVKDITFSPGESGALVWSKACNTPGFPLVGDLLDPAYPAVLLFRQLESVDRFKNLVRGQLIYTSPPQPTGGTTINYTLTDATQTNHIQTFCTADGSANLYVNYKFGAPTNVYLDDTDSTDWFHFGAPKIVTYRSLRAIGRATGDQWNAVKASIRAAAGTLNATPFGSDDRGWWLFLGPITRTQDNGASYVIQLDFVRGEKRHSFYPIGFYLDRDGRHPRDAATEQEVTAPGLPIVGGIYRTNGATIASIYEEFDWPPLFNFTPDD